MTNRIYKIRFNNCGQALVEFAIILPFLLLLILGITEFGRYLYFKNSATQAAREGARKAAVTKPWNEATVIQYMIDNSVITLSPGEISITPTSPTAGNPVSVTIRKHFSTVAPAKLPLLGDQELSLPFRNLTSIRAVATMRYE